MLSYRKKRNCPTSVTRLSARPADHDGMISHSSPTARLEAARAVLAVAAGVVGPRTVALALVRLHGAARGPRLALTAVSLPVEGERGEALVLRRASLCEFSHASTRHLQIEGVITLDVVSNVCDLNYVALAHRVAMGPTPRAVVDLVGEYQLEALATVFVSL